MKKLFLLIGAVLLLNGCSFGMDAVTYTELELKSVYLNEHDKDYRDLYESNDIEKFEAIYYDGVNLEVEFLAEYTETYYEELTDETLSRAVDIYDEIYSHSKFKVEATDDQNIVKVTISPIDIITKTVTEENVNAIYDQLLLMSYTNTQLENAYFNGILDLIEKELDNIGYLEEVELNINVDFVNSYYEISEEEFTNIDTYIIGY